MGETQRNIRPYYTLEFYIDDLDLSLKLNSVTIVTSMKAVYQTVVLHFEIDAKDFILEQIYGQKHAKIIITMMTEDNRPGEVTELELFIVKDNIPLSIKDNSQKPDHEQSDPIKFITIIRDSSKNMNTTINKLFSNTSPRTPIQAIKDIYDDYIGGESQIEMDNSNQESIYQMIIPPMTFNKAIGYIDGYFGIYKGPMFKYCHYDKKFYMWDLSKKINKQEEYLVYVLSRGAQDKDIMEESGSDDSTFYTYSTLQSQYKSNKNIIKNSFKQRIVAKPIDSLFKNIDIDMDDIFQNNSIIDGRADIKYDDIVKERYKYHSRNIMGYEGTEDFARAFFSRKISGTSDFSFTLHRNITLNKLTRIGIPIKVSPQLPEYSGYQGKYIVSNSIITFSRGEQQHWVARAKIDCLRGNLEYSDSNSSGFTT